MSKHFLTVLGTGGYQEAVYYCEEGRCKTSFIQKAVLDLKIPDWESGDKITVFVTKESKEIHWVTRPYTDKEIDNAKKEGKNYLK